MKHSNVARGVFGCIIAKKRGIILGDWYSHVVKLEGSPLKAEKRIEKAIEVLEAEMPKSDPSCSFCNWYEVIRSEIPG